MLINESELRGLAGEHGSSLEPTMQKLSAMMPQNARLVVKCGPEGAVMLHHDEFFKIKSPLVNVIDTIGAGDVFNAGFLSALLGGQSNAQMLTAAVEMASLAISTNPRIYLKPSHQERIAS